jgi:hypothetical protein
LLLAVMRFVSSRHGRFLRNGLFVVVMAWGWLWCYLVLFLRAVVFAVAIAAVAVAAVAVAAVAADVGACRGVTEGFLWHMMMAMTCLMIHLCILSWKCLS